MTSSMFWHAIMALFIMCIAPLVAKVDNAPILRQDDVKMQLFRSSGIARSRENGKLYDWMMSGSSANIHDSLYEIFDLNLNITPQNDENDSGQENQGKFAEGLNSSQIQVFSPLCSLNQLTSEIKSQERIEIIGEDFSAHGIGYDIFLQKTNLIITIRNSVHLTFKNINQLKKN